MRSPGIAVQLDELEYLLPGLYPGVVLAVEGKLPFQGQRSPLDLRGLLGERCPFRNRRWLLFRAA